MTRGKFWDKFFRDHEATRRLVEEYCAGQPGPADDPANEEFMADVAAERARDEELLRAAEAPRVKPTVLRTNTSALFDRMRSPDGDLYLTQSEADAIMRLIRIDEHIISEYARIVRELRTQVNDFVLAVTGRSHDVASPQTPKREPESDS